MESVNVFTAYFANISHEVHSISLENVEKEDVTIPKDDWISTRENSLACSYCRIDFPDPQSQRDHYKLDWHRYNLKQSLLSKPPIKEEEFDEKSKNDDLSSISGSDTEKEDTLDSYATAQGRIFLQNDKNIVFSLYKCLICDRKEELSDGLLNTRLQETCVNNKQWTILMLGGGHFAGAVFQGQEPTVHKTFHCYTVRAGQGGSQSSRDSKSGGSQPKSAGASLRRYNEQALVQHVKSVIESWKSEIDKSSLIIYRASGPYNRAVLFGGNTPILERSNPKLRTIPFSTRRATFTEVKRVHALLSSADVYGSLELASERFSKQKSPETDSKRNKIRSSCINRAKSREVVQRPLPTALSSRSSSEKDLNEINIKISDLDEELSVNDVQISLLDLREFDDSLTPEQRKKTPKKKKPKKSKTKKLKEQEEARKKELVNVLIKGDIDKLNQLLEKELDDANESENVENFRETFFNQIIDDNSNTLLHLAAINGHCDMLNHLLINNANPCLKNKNHQTPYTCTQSKEIRETLKIFAKSNPDKYNYNKAQIPVITLTDEELAEKKKLQRKFKREKEKEKKKENAIKKVEEEQRERFLKLSDREKRALAAERRILDQSGKIINRCFQCATDITGKVPFEYMKNLFCTIDCLKNHRMQSS